MLGLLHVPAEVRKVDDPAMSVSANSTRRRYTNWGGPAGSMFRTFSRRGWYGGGQSGAGERSQAASRGREISNRSTAGSRLQKIVAIRRGSRHPVPLRNAPRAVPAADFEQRTGSMCRSTLCEIRTRPSGMRSSSRSLRTISVTYCRSNRTRPYWTTVPFGNRPSSSSRSRISRQYSNPRCESG